MNILAIDTHEVVKELKAVGFSEDQAEAVTRVVRRSQDIDLSPLATKIDMEIATTATRADIDALRKDMDVLRTDVKANLAEQKADLLKWVVGAIGFQTVVILGAVLALAHALRP